MPPAHSRSSPHPLPPAAPSAGPADTGQQETDLLLVQRSALEVAANAVLITDRDGVIVWANPAFCASSGYTLAEARGRTPGELLKSGEHDGAFFQRLWETILHGGVWHGEIVNSRKGGGRYIEEMTITPLRSASGEISHFVAVKQDVTERKQLEAQIRQAQKMEAVGQLAGGVAHDFNNLLAAVLMHLGLLHDEPGLDPVTRASLRELEEEVQRGAGLTRQLLSFSRQQAMDARPLDLNEVISGLLKMLRRLLGEQVRLVFEPGKDLPPIEADPTMMEQVALNLCVNARDAMPRGGILRLETAVVQVGAPAAAAHAPGEYVRLTISDTGTGMDAATLEHLFEPFFTTKGPNRGTGLGLATVYGIVHQHGGWIDVASSLGVGSSFQVHLPALGAPIQPPAPQDPGGAPAPGRGETVLIAEDEASLRRILTAALTKAGYHVLEAEDGPAALELWLAHRDRIALLISDMVLPSGLTGLDLALRLRADRADLRVIIASGYSTVTEAEITSALPSVVVLRKPFSSRVLLAAVARSLQHASSDDP
jgi:two-component system, cell cycle sensor histidine kinase and response regulator CckA